MTAIELFSIFRVIAIFGSSSPKVDSSVSSVCSSLHIPHLTTMQCSMAIPDKNSEPLLVATVIYLSDGEGERNDVTVEVVIEIIEDNGKRKC